MRKYLTTGFLGAILGIVGAGTANASIVSSGFLDEKLTEYALSTSLDLKANQSDFTELNTQISNSIDNLKTLWNSEIGILADGFNPNKVNNDIEGAFGLVGGFIIHSMESLTRGWYESRDNFYQGIRQLNDGWTDSNSGQTYLGVKDLNTKIGTLPEGITVQAMYDGWTDSSGYNFPGLFDLASNTFKFNNLFPKTSIGMLLAHGLEEYTNGNYTGPVYPLWKLSEGIDKIGTLPSGQFHIRFPYLSIFESAGIAEPYNYPTSLSDLFLYLFGSNEDTTKDGLFPVIGMRLNNISTQINNINNTSNAIQSKIGTVPDGKNLAGMIGTLPDGYDSVGAALTAIKGIAEDAKAAALAAIPDPKQEGSSGKFVLTVDIVGDNATYRWEKIDREGETTTTTE